MPLIFDSSSIVLLVLSGLLSYFIGCINTAYYITRLLTDKDIRKEYSGTAGASNAGRILGRYGFFAVLILDILRGYFGVELCTMLVGNQSFSGIFLFFIILGHTYPIQLSFKGGKGAANAIGGSIAISCSTSLIFMGIFALLYAITKRKTFSGLTTFILFPAGCYYAKIPGLTLVFLSLTMLLILYTYYRRQNHQQ